MKSNVIRGEEAYKLILEGIDEVAYTVALTIGPNGKNVMLSDSITNDGVSIAREIKSENEYIQKGIEFIRDVAKEANSVAGDGTSTVTILTQVMARVAFGMVNWGSSPTQLRREIKEASEQILAAIKPKEAPPAMLRKIATVSMESKEIGEIIANAVISVGENGTVTYEPDEGDKVTAEEKSGYVLDHGYKNATLVNTPKAIEHKDVVVLVWNTSLSDPKPLLPIMESLLQQNRKQLIVVCSDVTEDMMAMIIENHVKNIFTIIPVPIYSFMGDMMEDIAAYTGATYLQKFNEPTYADTGFVNSFIQTSTETMFSRPNGNQKIIEDRINTIKAIEATGAEKKEHERRIGRLSGKIAVIKVGADSVAERDYLLRKVEDAINATKGARKAGVVAGAGCAYIHAIEAMPKPYTDGMRVLVDSISAPIKKILENSDIEYADYAKEIKKGKTLNALTLKWDDSIIDSYLTVSTALRVSVSAVSTLLTIGGVVVKMKSK